MDARPFMQLLSVSGRAMVLEVEGQYLALDGRPCRWLTPDKLCALHPDVRTEGLPPRPDLCGTFPEEPAQIVRHPECGFRFVHVDE